jgi:hypothetical protein
MAGNASGELCTPSIINTQPLALAGNGKRCGRVNTQYTVYVGPCRVKRKVQAQTSDIDRGDCALGAFAVHQPKRISIGPDPDQIRYAHVAQWDTECRHKNHRAMTPGDPQCDLSNQWFLPSQLGHQTTGRGEANTPDPFLRRDLASAQECSEGWRWRRGQRPLG